MAHLMTISPAYGRDYTSGREAVAALKAGKDFVLQPQGVYVGLEEIKDLGFGVSIRFGKLRKSVVLTPEQVASL